MKSTRNWFSIGLLGIFTALLAGCSTTNSMVSDSPTNPGMTKIFYEVDINAPKTEAWEVLRILTI